MLYIGMKLTKMREQIFEAKTIWTVFKAFHIAISAMSTSAILYKCFKNVHTIEGNKLSTKNSDNRIKWTSPLIMHYKMEIGIGSSF